MQRASLIYRNIFWYRLIMGVLYGGSYRRRFAPILGELGKAGPKTVLELCFGDVLIAEYCRKNNIGWKGFDINHSFVANACAQGFEAVEADVLSVAEFPKAEIVIIAGALYHFNRQELKTLFEKVFRATNTLLLSEPIENVSSRKGMIGSFAVGSSQTVRAEAYFRYNYQSLTSTLLDLGGELGFSQEIIGRFKKDLIVILRKT
jgi:hypothetical protein